MRTRLSALAGAEKGDDDGFTLIELMVVVLVIGILLAIAIPTFLGAREQSQDRAAQSSLRNALTAAKVAFVETGDYSEADNADLALLEPGLTYAVSATASTGPNEVSVDAAGTEWHGAALSDSGTCFAIRDQSDAGAASGTQYTTIATCSATAAKADTVTSWADTW